LTNLGQGVIFETEDLVKRGQSVIEYAIIFAVLAGLSLLLATNIPKIFENYVANATEKMK